MSRSTDQLLPGENIRVTHLSHAFPERGGGSLEVLDDIDLDIPGGEFVAVVGPSGCGKSTLLRTMAGLIDPTEGSITLSGSAIEDALARRRIGVVFQDPVLLEWRSVFENIRLPLELAGIEQTSDEKVRALIDLVRLSEFEKKLPSELSGGMRSRVALARSFVLNPTLLLLDEPFGALDEMTANAMNLELLGIWEARRPTVVFITHSLEHATLMADRVIVFSKRPGTILREIRIDLPRPRTFEMVKSRRYFDLNNEIRDALYELPLHARTAS